jgi:hypothetical protein
MKHTLTALILLAGLTSWTSQSADSPPPTPLIRAHSHNDYEHAQPLFDALEQGFCSIEADIYLVGGRLLVAHDRSAVKPERTLQALYLDPLRAQIKRHGGRVYPGGPPVSLLIDVKSDAEATYLVLRDVLRGYSDMLTEFSGRVIQTNAITVVISGNRAPKVLAAEPIRYAALDGRPEDLEGSAPKELIPWISQDWKVLFRWRGVGPFPQEEQARLRDLVDKTHRQGRILRFWGAVDRPEMWRTLLDAGVDLINTDNLAGLRQFLLREKGA